jgi:16S rRNA processing protein RimM
VTNYFHIGKLAATYGVKGQLVLQHNLGKKTSLKGLECIFIEMKKDELLPYFIEESLAKNETEVYLKLEGVDIKEKAQPLVQKKVWLTEEVFKQYASQSVPVSLLGFHIIDNGGTQ